MAYTSLAQLQRIAEENHRTLGQQALTDAAMDNETTEAVEFTRMGEMLAFMRQSVADGLAEDLSSNSGLTGPNAHRVKVGIKTGLLPDDILSSAITKALATASSNACMGKVVAAPTAGACGILPAILLTAMEKNGVLEADAILGLFTAGAVGMVISHRATLAGAMGGCQAECGSAAAMAAAAYVEMLGGTTQMALDAAAIALKCSLGLVCDPVAGLVEVPCVKRNAALSATALSAAYMALCGVESIIPVDEVIDAMGRVGRSMPEALRETGEGGIAASPTGRAIAKRVLGES
ncbi:L-serine ammonia-lyase, iron-sulfur-dependent, subunit alpha [Eubacteriales bacterium OttesenSCG-928-M02]|nr:L-serine ammonia-lyase, iron-sulfur-dependent, subunit alpha [Eubacteriales bacterium OttesenSCG-928-M02]